MVYRYALGQVYCTKCGYMAKETTWKDKSDHPRCKSCGSRVRTKPRSSRLKQMLRDHIKAVEELEINRSRTTVKGIEILVKSST